MGWGRGGGGEHHFKVVSVERWRLHRIGQKQHLRILE